MRLWICLALLAIVGAAKAQDHEIPDFPGWQDYYDDWYSDSAQNDEVLKETDSLEPTKVKDNAEEVSVEAKDAETNKEVEDIDKSVAEEITQFRKKIEEEDDKDTFNIFDDYQFEDNRSELKELDNVDKVDEDIDENIQAASDDVVAKSVIDEVENKDYNNDEIMAEGAIPLDDANQQIFEETRAILNEDNKDDNGLSEFDESAVEDKNEDDNFWRSFENTDDSNTNQEESKNSLAVENEETLEENNDNIESNNQELLDNDNAEELKDDLQDEIEQLFAEFDKMQFDDVEEQEAVVEPNIAKENENAAFEDFSDNSSDEINGDDQVETDNDNNVKLPSIFESDTADNQDSVPIINKDMQNADADNEEDTVDKVYADLDDDLNRLLDTWDKLTGGDNIDEVSSDEDVLDYEAKNGKPFREDVVLSQRDDDYENIDDSNFEKIFEDTGNNVKDDTFEIKPEETQIFYINDALVAEDENNNDDNANADTAKEYSEPTQVSQNVETKNEDAQNIEMPVPFETEVETTESVTHSIPVEELSPKEYNELMKQFAVVHSEDLDTQSEDFGRNVAPIHIKLSVDEPTIVTSPNYPNIYPRNNIVDWIFDGEGTGIELNITDLAITGEQGDYLMVKPGGIDESGSDGLIFSYTLAEPRFYRFLDVDRMFMRFQSYLGMGFRRGFSLSIRMVAPIPEEPEPQPEPEPLLPEPTELMTVNLGGVTLVEFLAIEEEFRQLVADMATVYINANGINMGLNTTSEVTQIVSRSICNVEWPNFTSCAEVKFGVPLVYEDETSARLHEDDLKTMWETYVSQDPFAFRLRRMGITEFAVPDDGHVLMVWLVIASGVVISMAMLAFALWRFSCFEDYTRMATFSDTDSMGNDKRGLDLYPTPHQTLPPLYADPEFKWDDNFEDSTRVDMGGFANRSYVPDELFDIDSDEDVITSPRDRNSSTISPRDIYPV